MTERRLLPYTVNVEMWWRSSVVSPFTGETVFAYGETVEIARQKADLLMWQEATERGFAVERPTKEELAP